MNDNLMLMKLVYCHTKNNHQPTRVVKFIYRSDADVNLCVDCHSLEMFSWLL